LAESEEQQGTASEAGAPADGAPGASAPADGAPAGGSVPDPTRGKTVHGEAANAGHRVLAPDDAEVEAYLEVALDAPAPDRAPTDPPVAAVRPEPGVVAILDFGSQFAQLIARRVRELNVYSELLPHDTPLAELERRGVRAIILSGGPNSVYDEGAPKPDASIWSGRLPVLGICYGAQLMAHELGGDVMATAKREYGPATVQITKDDGLFPGIDREQPVWMSHGDSVTRLPDGFTATAQTDSTPYAGFAAPDRNLYAIQFHPEVAHTPRGKDVLRNFVTGIARIAPAWTSANFIETTVAETARCRKTSSVVEPPFRNTVSPGRTRPAAARPIARFDAACSGTGTTGIAPPGSDAPPCERSSSPRRASASRSRRTVVSETPSAPASAEARTDPPCRRRSTIRRRRSAGSSLGLMARRYTAPRRRALEQVRATAGRS